MLKAISKRSILLLVLDFAAIFTAYGLAFRFKTGTFDIPLTQFPWLYIAMLTLPFLFYIFDLYQPYRRFPKSQTFIEVVFAVSVGSVLLAAASFLDRTLTLPRTIFAYTTALLIPLVFAVRMLYDGLLSSQFLDRRALVIGTGPFARDIYKLIRKTPHTGIEVLGLVSEKKNGKGEKNGIPVLGDADAILSLIDWYKIELAILAGDTEQSISEARVMAQLLNRKVFVVSAINIFEEIAGEIPYRRLGGHYLLGLMAQVKRRPYLRLKRILDFVSACGLFLILGPVMGLAALALAATSKNSPFFIQKRIGKDNKTFHLIKLRTMTDPKRGKQKITKLGKWIRRYRIDEFPQLINVIKGDMSMIGPRPEIPYFVQRSRKKIPFYSAVFAVRPGLTGWAQIKFWHVTSIRDYDQKFRFNLYYLKNISFALDFLIMLKTVRVILLGKGK